MTHGLFATQGKRSSMEDRHVVVEPTKESPFPACGSMFYAVFDGHGGVSAADFVADRVHRYVFGIQADAGCEPSRVPPDGPALAEALRRVDREFLAEANAMPDSREWESGCTAAVMVVRGKKVFTAHLGDTRAVIARGVVAIDLTKDHTPETERERVEAAGGWITTEIELGLHKLKSMQLEDPVIRKYAEAAVKWQSVSRVNSDLGVARAIGDADFKLGPRMARFPWNFPKGVARTFTADIVNGKPDIGEFDLEDGDRFVIIACDGLWDVFSSQQAVDLVAGFLDDHNSPEFAAERLVDLAVKLGSSDNVSVIVVLLPLTFS